MTPKSPSHRFQDMPDVPCGCRPCGCLCPEHSGTGRADPCDVHAFLAVLAWVAREGAVLASLGLFLAFLASIA